MTREEYLSRLKNNLLSLTDEERDEALKYYSDYFEEANDDEKVIRELGSPDELSKSIVERFANALVGKNHEEKSDEEKTSGASYSPSNDAMYFEFDKSKVHNLIMNFGAADIAIISGEKYAVETRGIEQSAFNCYLSEDGTLNINNSKRLNFNFWSHDRRRLVSRILITVPNGAKLEKLRATVGAGNLRSQDISISCESGNLEVGAGNLMLKSVYGGKIDFRCGMGNIVFDGSVSGRCNVDCGMGNVKITTKGNPEDYSYDIKLGLGDFKFNEEKRSGVSQVINNQKKQNHFSVNCGMGNVNIQNK